MAQSYQLFLQLPNPVWQKKIVPHLSDDDVKQLGQVNKSASAMLHQRDTHADFKHCFPSEYRYLKETGQLDNVSEYLFRTTWQHYYGSLSDDLRQIVDAIYLDDPGRLESLLTQNGASMPKALLSLSAIIEETNRPLLSEAERWRRTSILDWYRQKVDELLAQYFQNVGADKSHAQFEMDMVRLIIWRVQTVSEAKQYLPLKLCIVSHFSYSIIMRQVDLWSCIGRLAIQVNNNDLLKELLSIHSYRESEIEKLLTDAVVAGNVNALEHLLTLVPPSETHVQYAIDSGNALTVRLLLDEARRAKRTFFISPLLKPQWAQMSIDILKELYDYNRVKRVGEGSGKHDYYRRPAVLRLLASYHLNLHTTVIELDLARLNDIRAEDFSYLCTRECLPLYKAIRAFAAHDAERLFGSLPITSPEQLSSFIDQIDAYLTLARSGNDDAMRHPFGSRKLKQQIQTAKQRLNNLKRLKAKDIYQLLAPTDQRRDVEEQINSNSLTPIKLSMTTFGKTSRPDRVHQKYLELSKILTKRNRLTRLFKATLSGLWKGYQESMSIELITEQMDVFSQNIVDAKQDAVLDDMRLLQQCYDYMVNGGNLINPRLLSGNFKLFQKRLGYMESTLRMNREAVMVAVMITLLVGLPLIAVVLLFCIAFEFTFAACMVLAASGALSAATLAVEGVILLVDNIAHRYRTSRQPSSYAAKISKRVANKMESQLVKQEATGAATLSPRP